MVFLNYSTMQMVAKIVYYGPGLCGKTTNLKEIYKKTSVKSRGEMVSLETETDRTLFFDLLPMDVGVIGGFKTKFQLYTVPGQVFYNSTRKLVLRGVDGIVFVADSQIPMLDANLDSYENLKENLTELGLELADIPLVFQFNKRDLPNIHPVDKLNAILNDYDKPFIESSALKGIGVFETLKEISKQTLLKLRAKAIGSEQRKKEAVSLKVRGTQQAEKIKHDLDKVTEAPVIEEEHTEVKEDLFPEAKLTEIPEQDAIPENVSFDTYELDNTDGDPDLQLEEVPADQMALEDPDATNPTLKSKAAINAANLNSMDEEIELDSFDLELPEDDLLSEDDELDLHALEDLKEQVSEDLATEEMPSVSKASLSIPEEPEPVMDALPDEPQESPEDGPMLEIKHSPAPPVPLPPPGELVEAVKQSKELDFEEVDAQVEPTPSKDPSDNDADNDPVRLLEDTLPHEMVSVKTSTGKKDALSSTLKELENLNLKMPRPRTTKLSKSQPSVDDLLTGLVSKPSHKKRKNKKVKIKVPGPFDQAQLNCVFLDGRQNVIHTQLAKIEPEEVEKGKYQIKVTLDIEVDP